MKLPTLKRRNEIIKILIEEGYIEANQLSQQYAVSMETIRKDLISLERDGIACKTYGGAALSSIGEEHSLGIRLENVEKKQQIARVALTLLDDAKVVFMDAGTSVFELANIMNTKRSMDIVTNSLLVWETLDASHHNVFLTGGKKREKNMSLTGNWCTNAIKSVHADICFLGTSGIMDQLGPTTHSYQELEAKQMMIAQSDRVYVLADSDKFKEVGFHTLCRWEEIDAIVTDNYISSKVYEKYRKFVPIHIGEEKLDEKDSKNRTIL